MSEPQSGPSEKRPRGPYKLYNRNLCRVPSSTKRYYRERQGGQAAQQLYKYRSNHASGNHRTDASQGQQIQEETDDDVQESFHDLESFEAGVLPSSTQSSSPVEEISCQAQSKSHRRREPENAVEESELESFHDLESFEAGVLPSSTQSSCPVEEISCQALSKSHRRREPENAVGESELHQLHRITSCGNNSEASNVWSSLCHEDSEGSLGENFIEASESMDEGIVQFSGSMDEVDSCHSESNSSLNRASDGNSDGSRDTEDSNEADETSGDGTLEEPLSTASSAKFRAMLRDQYSEVIKTPVVATKGNILLMVLEMAKQNSDSVKAFIDSANLVNSVFANPILPTSKYLMDKLLKIDMGTENHYFCQGCKHYFGVFEDSKSLVCDNCSSSHTGGTDEDGALEKEGHGDSVDHFVTFDLINQLEIVLTKLHKQGVKLFHPKDALERNGNSLSDIYDGQMYKNFAREYDEPNPDEPVNHVISLIMCTDGSPLFQNNSGMSLWPVHVMVNELPLEHRSSNILLGALWFGKEKPDMKIFLSAFVKKLKILSSGFSLNICQEKWRMKAHLIGCCVDSGARGSVQFISTHGGYFSCNWCEIPGEYMFGSVRYPLMHPRPQRRTATSLIENGVAHISAISSRERLPQDRLLRAAVHKGVKGVTPLAECESLDIVNGFIVEHAHCVYLGIVRTFASIWESKLMKKQGDIEDKLETFNNRMKSLRAPVEVRRYPRCLEERIRWNAKECENFLLFFGIPVAQGLLPSGIVRHWFYLAQAMFLLLRTEVKENDVATAHQLLCHFCDELPNLYGEGQMTFNCHIVQHLCENVVSWGPLWAISGMAFENANGELKRKIKAVNGIPHQLHRCLWQERATDIIQEECSNVITSTFSESIRSKQRLKKGTFTPLCNFMGKSTKLIPSPREVWLCSTVSVDPKKCYVYCKIIKDKCLYTSVQKKRSQTYNAMAELNNGKIVHIQKIVMEEGNNKGYLFVHYMQCEKLFKPPTGIEISLSDHVVRKVLYECNDLQIVPVSMLKTVCVYSKFLHGIYVSPLPNIRNLY